jgi:hypothetical protein
MNALQGAAMKVHQRSILLGVQPVLKTLRHKCIRQMVLRLVDCRAIGAGPDKEYVESNMGRCIPAAGAPARYIRVYSGGYYLEGGMVAPNSGNYYTEIEVYGGSPTSNETTLLAIDIPKPQFL